MHRISLILINLFLLSTLPLLSQHENKKLQQLTDGMIERGRYLEVRDTVLLRRHQLDYGQDSLAASIVLNNLGYAYFQLSEMENALSAYVESLTLLDSGSIESAYRLKNIGIVYRKKGELSISLEYTLQAFSIFQLFRVSSQIASSANTIGLIYYDLGDYVQSLMYLKQALSIWPKVSPDKLHILYNNMGNVWFSLKEMDSAQIYYQRSIQESLRYGHEVASAYNNLAEVFVEADQLDSAATYFHLSLSLKKKFGNRSGMAYTYNMLGNLAMMQDDLYLAAFYLDSARVLEKEVGSLSIKMKNLELHKKFYKKQGRYKQAFLVDQQYDMLKDSIFNQEKVKTLELQAAYDLEQKDKEKKSAEQSAALARTNQQIEKQRANATLIVLSVVGLFLMIAAALLFLLFRQRKKLQQLNWQLNSQNESITLLNRQNLHFTKNSLTELGATIRLQAGQMDSDEIRQMLAEGSSRMETVNLLYKRLFLMNEKESQVLSSVVFLEEIIDGTLEVMLPPQNDVKVDCQIEPFDLTKEQGLSLGLLVNEVLVNACKYAFSSAQGSLLVKASSRQGMVLLHIEDSGPDISASLPQNDDSFGFRLIQSMADDLGADWRRKETSSGLSYYFSFPLIVDHLP